MNLQRIECKKEIARLEAENTELKEKNDKQVSLYKLERVELIKLNTEQAAHIERLRKAINTMDYDDQKGVASETPIQSLATHDDKVRQDLIHHISNGQTYSAISDVIQVAIEYAGQLREIK